MGSLFRSSLVVIALLVASVMASQKYGYASSWNTYEEVEVTSWVDDMFGSTVAAFVIAPILLIVGIWVLIWNEKRALRLASGLKELLHSVYAASDSVEPALESRVIHVTGRLQPTTTLVDEAFGISLSAIRLKRVVETFQWHEKSVSHSEKNVGGGTTTHKHYSYDMHWSESLIDSSNFKMPMEHQNPKARLFEPFEETSNCIFGKNYSIPDDSIRGLNNYKLLTLNEGIYERLRPELQGRFRLYQNCLYSGDPNFPQIGDARISFHRIEPELYSVVGRQQGSHIVPFRSSQGDNLFLIKEGTHSAPELISQEESGNRIILFIMRFVGWLFVFLGVSIMLDPIATFFDVLPFLGGIIRLGSTTFAFVVSLTVTLFIIGLIWIAHNLSVGMLLLALAAAALLTSSFSGSSKL